MATKKNASSTKSAKKSSSTSYAAKSGKKKPYDGPIIPAKSGTRE